MKVPSRFPKDEQLQASTGSLQILQRGWGCRMLRGLEPLLETVRQCSLSCTEEAELKVDPRLFLACSSFCNFSTSQAGRSCCRGLIATEFCKPNSHNATAGHGNL